MKYLMTLVMLIMLLGCEYRYPTETTIIDCDHSEGTKVTFKLIAEFEDFQIMRFFNSDQAMIQYVVIEGWEYFGYYDHGDSLMLEFTPNMLDDFEIQIIKGNQIYKSYVGGIADNGKLIKLEGNM